MTEAARLEQSLADVERERFDLVRGGRRLRRRLSARVSGRATFAFAAPPDDARGRRRARARSRRCSTSWSPTPSSSRPAARSTCALARDGDDARARGGQRRPAAAGGHAGAPVRVDGVGARRAATPTSRTWGSASTSCALIAQFHGGTRDGGESERPAGRIGQRPRAARPLTSSRAALGMAMLAPLRWRWRRRLHPQFVRPGTHTRRLPRRCASPARCRCRVPPPASVRSRIGRAERRGGLQPRRHLARFVRRDAAVVVAGRSAAPPDTRRRRVRCRYGE